MKNQASRHKLDDERCKEPVKVFCRIKPIFRPTDMSCIKQISDSSLIITSPESGSNCRTINKAIQTSFSRILGPEESQKKVFCLVALPLVENLINGKNGLLFTYGVSGSGKTYTMSGDSRDNGIMPRCLDVLFNSIANFQAKRFVFKPDKLNNFDVQNEEDARSDRQNELHCGPVASRNGKSFKFRKQNHDSNCMENILSPANESQSLIVDEDYVYAVFVTYVEIYNNNVYDLLEVTEGSAKSFQSKIVREDGNKNMYVHGGTEIEAKSSEEAFEIFQRAQRRRHVAQTALNADSSRSHTVFTIRLVQAPLDSEGEQVVQDKRIITISQLSLVDLAGSERTSRSKNSGQRLKEAGNINNSLMMLRCCLEILRENQIQSTNKIVPYRDSKLTHLFKNFFDGDGIVRMIVCVNPSVDDYDETIQVMKFAEVSQEVQIGNCLSSKLDLGYQPGRRQANKVFKEARNRLLNAGHEDAADLEVDLDLVYSLGGPFPELDLGNPHNDEVITKLMRFLESRIQKRNILQQDLHQKRSEFRNMLVKVEHENVSLRIEASALRATNNQQKRKISTLEAHVCKTEAQIDTLLGRLNGANDMIRHMQQELKDKNMLINQRAIDKQRVKDRYTSKMQAETDKMSKELETKLRRQREFLQNQIKDKENKLKLVKKILVNDVEVEASTSESSSTPESLTDVEAATIVPTSASKSAIPKMVLKPALTTNEMPLSNQIVDTPISSPKKTPSVKLMDSNGSRLSRKERIPVVNLRYRRSQSADRWLDHRPTGLVPVGTILQPLLRNKRNVTQLTDPKDITERASRYCLVAQEHDTDGELETKLYKGDILPTSGGGAQVIFNEMEHLKQVPPVPGKKRSGYLSPESKNKASMTNDAPAEETISKKARV